MKARRLVHRLGLATAVLIWIGCKSDPPRGTLDGPAIDAPAIDAPIDSRPIDGPPDGPSIDALPASCLGQPQCSDCIDNDNDGNIDTLDLECTMSLDNDEASFATGIPGDNIDAVLQDCFYDGNSGAGNDGCNIHVCCLLGATTVAQCPIGASQYNPANCPPPIGTTPLPQMCLDTCGKLTPPGCDCFGCCTICDPITNVCVDVATNPNTSPGCTQLTFSDPAICHRCTKVPSCGHPTCGGATCILCPGQDRTNLPLPCMGLPVCPTGVPSCEDGAPCPAQTYCDLSSKCCLAIVQ